MKIQKGIVKYKDRDDIVCTYGVTDDGRSFYFIDYDRKLPKGNIIASTELVEAVDPMFKAKRVGVIDMNGKEVLPFKHRAIRPINDEVLLAEIAQPVSPSVVEANRIKNDPALATQLVSTPALIKDHLNSKMSSEGRYVFNDQFSEATIYDMDGNNLLGNEYYSFIGMDNNKLFFCKNTADSPIVEYSLLPAEVQNAVTENSINVSEVQVPTEVVENALNNTVSSEVAEQATAPDSGKTIIVSSGVSLDEAFAALAEQAVATDLQTDIVEEKEIAPIVEANDADTVVESTGQTVIVPSSVPIDEAFQTIANGTVSDDTIAIPIVEEDDSKTVIVPSDVPLDEAFQSIINQPVNEDAITIPTVEEDVTKTVIVPSEVPIDDVFQSIAHKMSNPEQDTKTVIVPSDVPLDEAFQSITQNMSAPETEAETVIVPSEVPLDEAFQSIAQNMSAPETETETVIVPSEVPLDEAFQSIAQNMSAPETEAETVIVPSEVPLDEAFQSVAQNMSAPETEPETVIVSGSIPLDVALEGLAEVRIEEDEMAKEMDVVETPFNDIDVADDEDDIDLDEEVEDTTLDDLFHFHDAEEEEDRFQNSIVHTDQIDVEDEFNEPYQEPSYEKHTDSVMADVAKSMAALMKQNRDLKRDLAATQEKLDKVTVSRRNIADKSTMQEKKISVLTSKIRSLETSLTKADNKSQLLEERVRSQENELSTLRSQLQGRDDLVKLVADAQLLLGDEEDSYYRRAA